VRVAEDLYDPHFSGNLGQDYDGVYAHPDECEAFDVAWLDEAILMWC